MISPDRAAIQAQITELEQSGGVPSLVVRVNGSRVVPAPSTVPLQLGSTLRLILVVNTAAVVSNGAGILTPVRANTPTAVDLLPMAAGTYLVRLTEPRTLTLLRLAAR